MTVEYNKLKAENLQLSQLRSKLDNLETEMSKKDLELRESKFTIQELTEDILELKQMYRMQIDELTRQVE